MNNPQTLTPAPISILFYHLHPHTNIKTDTNPTR